MTQPAKKAPAKRATSRRTAAEKPAAPPEPPKAAGDTPEAISQAEWMEVGKPGAMMVCPTDVAMPSVHELWPSVHELWCRVMESVESVEKGDYNKDQHFRFRGIDAVMEAVGPALRKHRVHVRPRRVLEHSATEYTSKSGGRMVNRVVRVEWEVTGPLGDSFVGESMGEAADSSDKSMTKAQSVAYRVFLLNALTIPTGDPDPDAETHERATPSEREQAVAQATLTREEYERRQLDAQRQAQAGEENQDAPDANTSPEAIERARKELWRLAKGLGWQWSALANRFKADNDGLEMKQTSVVVIEGFAQTILREAEEEEDRAKKIAADELGAKEVAPDEAQTGGGDAKHF